MSYFAITSDIVSHQQFGALTKLSSNDLASCVANDIEQAKSQGWPKSELYSTSSFLKSRNVQVRFQGGVTEPKELACGAPQGSPVFPLLFLLYMAEPMWSGNTIARFSYADYFGILGFGCTISESAAVPQREADCLTNLAEDNAVLFDAKKSEVIQFPGHKKEDFIVITVNGDMIKPAEHIRWLGVHLSPYLSFKHHGVTWCAKD